MVHIGTRIHDEKVFLTAKFLIFQPMIATFGGEDICVYLIHGLQIRVEDSKFYV